MPGSPKVGAAQQPDQQPIAAQASVATGGRVWSTGSKIAMGFALVSLLASLGVLLATTIPGGMEAGDKAGVAMQSHTVVPDVGWRTWACAGGVLAGGLLVAGVAYTRPKEKEHLPIRDKDMLAATGQDLLPTEQIVDGMAKKDTQLGAAVDRAVDRWHSQTKVDRNKLTEDQRVIRSYVQVSAALDYLQSERHNPAEPVPAWEITGIQYLVEEKETLAGWIDTQMSQLQRRGITTAMVQEAGDRGMAAQQLVALDVALDIGEQLGRKR